MLRLLILKESKSQKPKFSNLDTLNQWRRSGRTQYKCAIYRGKLILQIFDPDLINVWVLNEKSTSETFRDFKGLCLAGRIGVEKHRNTIKAEELIQGPERVCVRSEKVVGQRESQASGFPFLLPKTVGLVKLEEISATLQVHVDIYEKQPHSLTVQKHPLSTQA